MDMKRTTKHGLCLLALIAYCATASADVVINEIQVANIDWYIDPSYNYGGWIELYNTGDESVSLSGMQIKHIDSDGISESYSLTESHGQVQAHGYVCLWFDHNSKDGTYGSGASTQIPFKLDADGGRVLLTDKSQKTIDAVDYPAAVSRSSYARTTDGGTLWRMTSKPTPKATNNNSVYADEQAAPPTVDTGSTLFSESISFTVAIPDGTTLYYTTDGSAPMVGGENTFISNNGFFSTSETSVYRFMLTKSGMLNSNVITRTFIKRDTDYGLPVLCVNSHPDNFFDDTIGLYVVGTNGVRGNNKSFPCNQNMDWERPVSIELLEPEDGTYVSKINQEGLFAIFGGWTRFNKGDDFWEYKTSFKLKAEKANSGTNFFPYAVFDSKPHIKLKTMLVRNGGQDQYGRMWDATLQEILRKSGIYLDLQAYQPCQVFINGKYLGMFNLREASNKQFAYSNYGIGSDEIDQWENDITVKAGTLAQINKWYELSNKIASTPSDTATWNSITATVDVDEYCNYMAAEMYLGNADWIRTGLKNVKGFNSQTDNGKIHFVTYDLDGCFADATNTVIMNSIKTASGKLCKIFRNMLKHDQFKRQFRDAYCLMGGSIMVTDRCKPIIDSITTMITPALALEGELYNPTAKATKLLECIADRDGRYSTAINNLKSLLSIKGAQYDVKISASTNQCRLLLNGLEIPYNEFNGILFEGISLKALADDSHRFKGWAINGTIVCADSILPLDDYASVPSGIHTVEAVFTTNEDASLPHPVCINEVSSKNDIYISDYMKKGDWIELYNTTDHDINLSGMWLSDDRTNIRKYQISSSLSTVIPAHGFRIVWCDKNSEIDQLHAPFKLSNGDQSFICISAADCSWTDSLVYGSQGRWQSFGRYPDGSNNIALFDRITIEQSNKITTTTRLDYREEGGKPNAIEGITENTGRVIEVQYYNLSGQRIKNPAGELIVIQKELYDNGTYRVRKLLLDR